MDKSKQANLADILNYEADTYLKAEEIALIQSTFKDARMMRLLRKVMLPTVGDPDMPIEEVGSDMWLVGRDYAAMPNEEIKSVVLARQEAIKFVVGGLIKLKMIANQKVENSVERALREKQNSSK